MGCPSWILGQVGVESLPLFLPKRELKKTSLVAIRHPTIGTTWPVIAMTVPEVRPHNAPNDLNIHAPTRGKSGGRKQKETRNMAQIHENGFSEKIS